MNWYNTVTIAWLMLPYVALSQSFHADINAQIGSYTDQRPDIRLRIKTGEWLEGNSGLLIENHLGRAHTWLPYRDGSIYLTGDGIERVLPGGSTYGGDGHIILRTFDQEGYHDIMKLDGSSKDVRIHSLGQQSFTIPPVGTGRGLVTADRTGVLKRRQQAEVWSAGVFHIKGDGNGHFSAFRPNGRIAVQLPQGVRISSVKAVVVDENPSSNVYFQLNGHHPIDGQNGMVAWGQSNGTPGLTTIWGQQYGDRIIDNDDHTYHIIVGGTGPLENYNQGTLRFRSIHIYYEY